MCKNCGCELVEESIFCNKCGLKIVTDDEKVEREIASDGENFVPNPQLYEQSSTPRRNTKRIFIISSISLIVLLFIGGGAWYYYNNYMTPEAKAKNTVIAYLKASKNAESTYEYKTSGVDDFINVLDYKFVRIAEKEEKPKLREVSRDEYTKYGDTIYKEDDFQKYWESWNDIYKNVGYKLISESTDKNVYESDEMYYEITVIFDMEVTNGLGDKIYKKVYFTLNNELGDYRIEDIFY